MLMLGLIEISGLNVAKLPYLIKMSEKLKHIFYFQVSAELQQVDFVVTAVSELKMKSSVMSGTLTQRPKVRIDSINLCFTV